MMNIEILKTIAYLSWRNIWRNRKRSILIMSTALVGLLGVFLMLSFMNSLRKIWVDDAINSGFLGHVQVRPKGFEQTRRRNLIFKKPNEISQRLKKFAILTPSNQKLKHHFSYRFERSGFIRLGGKMQGLNIVGIDIDREKPMSKFDEWIIQGSYLTDPSARDMTYAIIPCLLGKFNADKLEVEVGDTVILSMGKKNGNSRSIRARIQGIFKSFAEPIDKNTLIVRREDLSRLYQGVPIFSDHKEKQEIDLPKELSYAMYLTQDKQYAKLLAKKLISGLSNSSNRLDESTSLAPVAKDKNDKPKLADILDYTQMNPHIQLMLNFDDQFSVIIYFIMLIGFAFVLLNSVLMSVFERTREIGILRALGSGQALVFFMIVFECLLLGFLGAMMGIVFSYLIILIPSYTGISLASLAKAMELLGGVSGTMIYPSLNLKDLILGLEISLFISVLAAIYPAVKAVKLIPVKAIYNR